MRVRNDEIRQLCKLARAMGYAVQQTKRLHLKFTKPGRPPVFCSSTRGTAAPGSMPAPSCAVPS
ncbi:hypothetical protein P4119_21475 [Pseudomonas aeruginosa]|nr:hypothetical protein [Pseudomonas aeruginosa]